MVESTNYAATELDQTLLATVAAAAARAVPGVTRLSDHLIGRLTRMIVQNDAPGGVIMRRTVEGLEVDMFVVIEPDTDMLGTAQRVEREVADALKRVGTELSVRVRVHIEDISRD